VAKDFVPILAAVEDVSPTLISSSLEINYTQSKKGNLGSER
jgi:hypothetical protein